jgi:NAD(P)-dependent dehydrogenase (short-subunit alcohol dehydrogenase family)
MPHIVTSLIAVAALLTSYASFAQSDVGVEKGIESMTSTVLITGANRGIGLELARQYLSAGWDVIGTARNPGQATELRDLNVRVLQLDVTDQESVVRLAHDLGDQSIDILINNAGILPVAKTIPDINFDDVNRVLAVNTVGPIRVTQALLPNLRQGALRKIINITSGLGSIAENTSGGFYGYRESKAALNMFTKSLSAELGPEGFTCIVVHPGWVQTDMGGKNAAITTQESVRGIRDVVDNLTQADNGTFWNHDGNPLPW